MAGRTRRTTVAPARVPCRLPTGAPPAALCRAGRRDDSFTEAVEMFAVAGEISWPTPEPADTAGRCVESGAPLALLAGDELKAAADEPGLALAGPRLQLFEPGRPSRSRRA